MKTGVAKRLYCGKIEETLAERIKKDIGVDLLNYNVSITSWFENSHSDETKEALRGQTAITPDIVAKFPYVISNYDKVELAGETKDQRQAIKFEKAIDGKKVVVTYVTKRGMQLQLQTMYGWALKKNSHHTTNASDDANARTSETSMDMSSNNSISNSAKKSTGTVQNSDRNYTYDALISKKNMAITKVQSTTLNRKEVMTKAIENVQQNGRINENGNAVIYVDDIKRNIIVPNHSITHGMDRRFKTQAPVLLHIGEVLKNAIRINELNPRSEDVNETYALVGVASDNNVFYTVSFVVNSYTNEVDKIDVLYSSNTKKGPAALLPTFTENFSATPTDPDISIANLLELVNMHFADLLPEDVLRKFGYDRRPEGKIGDSALYSDRDNTYINTRELLLE